jgi:hypothetical protein
MNEEKKTSLVTIEQVGERVRSKPGSNNAGKTALHQPTKAS